MTLFVHNCPPLSIVSYSIIEFSELTQRSVNELEQCSTTTKDLEPCSLDAESDVVALRSTLLRNYQRLT